MMDSRNDDGASKENVTWKYIPAQLRLFGDFLILFAFYNVKEEPCNCISLSAVKVNTQN